MVDVAKEVGADAVAHGCTGKGNDQVDMLLVWILIWWVIFIFWCLPFLQVRFELTFYALNPELKVVAPWREWDITGREDAIEYAKKHNVPVPVSKKSIYSRDRNLWHLSHEVLSIFLFIISFSQSTLQLFLLLVHVHQNFIRYIWSKLLNQYSLCFFTCHICFVLSQIYSTLTKFIEEYNNIYTASLSCCC